MPTVSRDLVLQAHPVRIWEFITTLRYIPLWMDGIASVQAISDPHAGAGTTFTALQRGYHEDDRWLVAEYEAPSRLRLVEYHHNREFIFLLRPDREGTRFSMRYTWPSERGILERFFRPAAQEQMVERSMAKLQEVFSLNQDLKLLHGVDTKQS